MRNARDSLAACLESIRRQRGPSWECIAVDDGSNDGSGECLARAAAEDARFRVLTQPPEGIVAALMRGLGACQGRYVARMDADDLMLARRLERQMRALESEPSLAGVGCHVRIFPRPTPQRAGRDARHAGRREYEAWLNSVESADQVARDAFIECPLAHPTWMLERSVLERYGYRDAGWPEDYDLLLRLIGDGHRLGVVRERLLCWRDGDSRLSRTSGTYSIERFIACKAHFLARGFLRETGDGYLLWGYGSTGRCLAKALLEYGKRPAAIIDVHPGRVGQRILGARVISPEELPAFMRVRRLPIIASVARREPRREVRAALANFGYVELEDYVCAA